MTALYFTSEDTELNIENIKLNSADEDLDDGVEEDFFDEDLEEDEDDLFDEEDEDGEDWDEDEDEEAGNINLPKD